MSRRALALALWLAVGAGCTNSAVIFASNEPKPGDDAGPDSDADSEELADASAADGGLEPDAAAEADAAGARDGEVRDGGLDAGGASATALAAYEHTCAARADGTYCWGRNEDGQLGLGADHSPAVFSPRRLLRALPYLQLCAGEQHSCGLRADGRIDCWGGNGQGQLGLGDTLERDEPTVLRSDVDFKAIACGGEQTCAIGEDDRLYCWGDNFEGQGGQNDAAGSPDLLVPTRVDLPPGIAQVSVGQGHVCALSSTGTIYCWGRNTKAQLGLGRGAELQIRKPTPHAGGATYAAVAAAQVHSCAVRKDRRLFCWGDSVDGLLGLGPDASGLVYDPTQVGSFTDYQSVQANWFHSCALRAGGALWCWGRNQEGQLGLGDLTLRDQPTLVSGLEGVGSLAVGHFHTCAAQRSAIYCWGENREGQLGLGDDDRRDVPTRVSF
jgi:alpha-tubulin suppressor-like RCC1 family protein